MACRVPGYGPLHIEPKHDYPIALLKESDDENETTAEADAINAGVRVGKEAA